MINTSNKALEKMLKTCKACKSSRHEDGTKPDPKIAKKQSE
jgi:hypothetical protein